MKTPARIAIMSDLHNEFERVAGPRRPTRAYLDLRARRKASQGHPQHGPFLAHLRGENIDLVVMAGDIDLEDHGIRYADEVSMMLRVPVVILMGNHEPYTGRDLDLLIPEMRATARKTAGRVHFLENEAAVFDLPSGRLHVLGCALFTDYRCNGEDDRDIAHAMHDAAISLNDHQRIFMGGRQFTPEMALEMHLASRAWLGQEVARIRAEEGLEARILIVTHHAPIMEANPPQYRCGKLAPAFVSDLRKEIAKWKPVAWIWGHTHFSMMDKVGETMLISAQRGYICAEPGAEDFSPAILVL